MLAGENNPHCTHTRCVLTTLSPLDFKPQATPPQAHRTSKASASSRNKTKPKTKDKPRKVKTTCHQWVCSYMPPAISHQACPISNWRLPAAGQLRGTASDLGHMYMGGRRLFGSCLCAMTST